MVNYEVTVTTANIIGATTFNNVFIKLVGMKGESDRSLLVNLKGPLALTTGTVSLKCFDF